MTDFQVAQLNVARARGRMTEPVMAGFVALLDDAPTRDQLVAVPE